MSTTCRVTPGCNNPIENHDTGACASCGAEIRKAERAAAKDQQRAQALIKKRRTKAPINKVSKKQSSLLVQYHKERKPWLKGKRCAVYPDQPATTVHHMKGREGYADEWARQNNITLLLDKRYWLPTSIDGHIYIENHRAWAEEKGFTLSRSEKI